MTTFVSPLTIANSLDPDQARQYVGLDLDPNCLMLDGYLNEIFDKDHFEKKKYEQTTNHEEFPNMQRVDQKCVPNHKIEVSEPRSECH